MLSGSTDNIKKSAMETLQIEIENLQSLLNNMDNSIVEAVSCILEKKNRVVITGIGKSAIIAQKIVATLNSTGTPAVFMHAADAVHGDLGMIQPDDPVIVLSNSGNTPEIKELVPLIKNFKNPLIAFTGNENSFLGEHADIIVSCKINKEACPNNLAPTSSTTAQMVMGDALAVALIKAKKFTSKDFSKFHPGGNLGKKMYTTVRDICTKSEAPSVQTNDSLSLVLAEISAKRLGATAVIEDQKICGIVTDGDIRRALIKEVDIYNLTAKDVMTSHPKHVLGNLLAMESLSIFKEHKITQLLVVDEENKYEGILHLHDLHKEGIIE
jgi:arabinose-5-phosphate isomerase